MSRPRKIQSYNPKLNAAENAKINGVSVEAMRSYIKANGIDRRRDRKQAIIDECKKYLRKNPNATRDEIHKVTGHSVSTIGKYWEYITCKNKLTESNDNKVQSRQVIDIQQKQKRIAFLNDIPLDFLKDYIKNREENPPVEEVTILSGIPFKPFEEFQIPVDKCIQFHSEALPENQVLSNHYECIITFRGVEFYGLEQMYAALTYSYSPSIVKKIMSCTSGKNTKSFCDKTYPDKRDWDFNEKRYRIIALCHLFKYLSVKEFRDRLRETYPQTLVECPKGKDYHFGMVQNLETNMFEGNNCSGRTMMAVRDMMKEYEDYEIGYNEALLEREFSEEEKEDVREALYGDIRYTYENDKQVIKDSKSLFTIFKLKRIPLTRVKKKKTIKTSFIDENAKCLVMDFDDTLFDTSADDAYRKCKGDKDWGKIFEMIPQYKLYDGWQSVFDWTKKNGVKIAVLSSASGQLIGEAFKHFNLPCDAVVGSQRYLRKPNAILGNMLQGKVKTRHEHIIYVGNSKVDEIQARASQFRFVGAVWQTNDRDYFEGKGIQVISSPQELIPIMEKAGWKKKSPRTNPEPFS